MKIRRRISPRYREVSPYFNCILKYLRMFPEASVLDVGGHRGDLLAKLYNRMSVDGYLNGLYVNLDMSSIGKMDDTKMHSHLEYIVADAGYLPFRNHVFDVVYSISLLEHVRKPMKVIAEISRTAKRFIILQIPNMQYYLEIHTLFPLMWLLPKGIRDQLSRKLCGEFLNFISFKKTVKEFRFSCFLLIGVVKLFHTRMLKNFLLPLGWIIVFVRKD